MIYNPRASVILDEMESAIRDNHEIIFLGCNGELVDACPDNLFKSKIACKSCRYFKKNDLSILSKKIKQYSISDFYPQKNKKYQWEYTTNTINNIIYKNSDIGTACLSTYINITRNQKPEITPEFKKMFDKLLDTAAMLTDTIENAIRILKPNKIVLFNSRIHTRKPIYRAAQNKKINYIVLDHDDFPGNKNIKKHKYVNSTPHSVENIYRTATVLWNKTENAKRIKLGTEYFERKLNGQTTDDISYTKKQNKNLIPQDWDSNKHNISIFNSSDDEFASLGKDWEYTFGKNIYITINDLLLRFISEKDFHFYLRIHPNLKNVSYYYHKVLYNLSKFENLTIIHPESKISTYSLLMKSDKIITFGSTIGIEAVYWGKPSILLRNSLYKFFGGNYMPESFEDLINLIKNKELQPLDNLAALKYGFFRNIQGEKFKYFDPNITKRFQISIKDKLLFEYVSDYRDKLYKIKFPKIRNFIMYKLYSVPKNFRKKFLNNISTTENKQIC